MMLDLTPIDYLPAPESGPGIEADDEHTLNVQAVEIRTGVCAETLRTWERRYGWPRPRRLANGYRAYSEKDVAMIQAVKREMDQGAAAAVAWQRVLKPRARCSMGLAPRSTLCLHTGLVDALLAFDGGGAACLLAEAHAIYRLEQVLVEIIQPALAAIGERWRTGEATVAQEHFASNLMRDSLAQMGAAYRPGRGARTVLVGAAPGEWHELGALGLSVLLRQAGHRVLYLGPNVPIDGLARAVELARADVLLLSANGDEPAAALADVPRALGGLSPRPLFVFGGQAFARQPRLAGRIDGIFIPGNADAACEVLDELLARPGL